MKSIFVVVLLAAIVTGSVDCNQLDVVGEVDEVDTEYNDDGIPLRTVPESRQNLILGTVGPDDRLMARIGHSVSAAPYIIHDQDVTFRGAPFTNITAIQVERVGSTQHAVPTLKAGGLGRDFVTINILGARGRAFSYIISVFASIGCSNS